MEVPKICLTLTGSTLAEDLAMLNKYRDYVDIAELRADFLNTDERLLVRRFPQMAGIPCILTIRRHIDGGQYLESESSRTILFAKALSFAGDDSLKNFDYIDFEEDYHVSSLEDAALAFGTKIIRSVHDMENPIVNVASRLKEISCYSHEIPKIAFMPHSLKDVERLFQEAEVLPDNNHILIAMGPLGVPSRILSYKLKNFLTFTSPAETNSNLSNLAHLDPKTMCELYNFKNLNEQTKLYGITGWPLSATSSPALHNSGYHKKNMDAVYVPFRAEKFEEAFSFANTLGINGFSVTIPHKEEVPKNADFIDEKVKVIGASNTMVKDSNGKWNCYNTDASGFARALLEFTGFKNLKHKKVAIIGAGGAARGIAYAIKELGAKACVFNRTVSKAKALAEQYDFEYAPLSYDACSMIKKYSDIIIQTTSKGMNSTSPSDETNDPLYFYEFTGKEMLLDIVYVPEITPIMKRAREMGCSVCNGYEMLKYQGWEQFKLFTGEDYDN